MSDQDKIAIYRNSTIGTALLDELDARVNAGQLTTEQANLILQEFDSIFTQQLEQLSQQNNKIEGKLQGRADMYRFTRSRADLELSDVKIQYTKPNLTNRVISTDQVFIRAHNQDSSQ